MSDTLRAPRRHAATTLTLSCLSVAGCYLGGIGAALADSIVPQWVEGLAPRWQVWHSPPVTPVGEQVDRLHALMFVLMFAITALVVILLLYVLVRFNARRHPKPSRRSHNTVLEIAWTILPVIVLVVIAIPSFRARPPRLSSRP